MPTCWLPVAAGRIHAAGPPQEVLTEALLRAVFGLAARVVPDPVTEKPMMVPVGRHGTSPARGDRP